MALLGRGCCGPTPESLRRRAGSRFKSLFKSSFKPICRLEDKIHLQLQAMQFSRAESQMGTQPVGPQRNQAGLVRVASKTRLRDCRTSGNCAMLRTFESQANGKNTRLLLVCLFSENLSVTAQIPTAGRHKKLARTQCLTSADCCLCSQPNSFALLSPIPKLASAARSRHSSTDAGNIPGKHNPLTLRHLATYPRPQPDRLPLF